MIGVRTDLPLKYVFEVDVICMYVCMYKYNHIIIRKIKKNKREALKGRLCLIT